MKIERAYLATRCHFLRLTLDRKPLLTCSGLLAQLSGVLGGGGTRCLAENVILRPGALHLLLRCCALNLYLATGVRFEACLLTRPPQ